jgi:hypothetical protein
MANNTDLIDKYLRNELTEDEKNQFERLLSTSSESLGDKDLASEVDLQKEIIIAIQARGLKECLQQKEQQIRSQRLRTKRIITLSSWGISSSFVAAIVVLAMILTPMAKIMKTESSEFVASITIPTTRGVNDQSDELQNQLFFVYSYIYQNQFDQANELALQLIDQIQSSQQKITPETKEILDQAQWLHTICEMHNGKVLKAKKLLKQIANSDSYYAERAQMVLDKL